MLADSIKQAFELLISDPGLWSIVMRSLEVSGLAVFFGGIIGIPLGVAIGLSRFRGRSALVAVINTGMAVPPVVVGLVVYLMLSRSGPFGSLHLLYTKQAMVVAQLILALPFILGITVSGIGAVPAEVLQQARSLGATRLQTASVALREARVMLLVALIAGTGRVSAEVGAVMMVGGNIKGDTQVMTTAIMEKTGKGEFAQGLALGLILLAIALAANGFMTRLEQRAMVS